MHNHTIIPSTLCFRVAAVTEKLVALALPALRGAQCADIWVAHQERLHSSRAVKPQPKHAQKYVRAGRELTPACTLWVLFEEALAHVHERTCQSDRVKAAT